MALFEGNTSTYSACEPPKQLQMAQMKVRLSPSSILQHSRLQRLFWQKGVRVPYCLYVWLHISAAELHRWLCCELRALSIQIVLQGCSVQKVPLKDEDEPGLERPQKEYPMQSIWGYTTAQWKTQQPAYKNGFTSHSEKKFQVDLCITFSFKPGAEREGRTGREVGDGAAFVVHA
jgi:hypothetical protein